MALDSNVAFRDNILLTGTPDLFGYCLQHDSLQNGLKLGKARRPRRFKMGSENVLNLCSL